MAAPYQGDSTTMGVPGLKGTNSAGGDGVFGDGGDAGRGVVGVSRSHTGVEGNSATGTGVFGRGEGNNPGVEGHGPNVGVFGESPNRGVNGVSTTGDGVFGQATSGRGVVAVSDRVGVDAFSTGGTGVFGNSNTGIGVHGKGGRLAGFFEGDLEVTERLVLRGVDIGAKLRDIETAISAITARLP